MGDCLDYDPDADRLDAEEKEFDRAVERILAVSKAQDIKQKIIDRLLEAVRTGEHCGTWDVGPRRVAAISHSGLHLLTHYRLWPEAMRWVVELGKPAHPRAQQRFAKFWYGHGWVLRGEYVGNDELFFQAMRLLLPPYAGPPMTLYRGQVYGQWIGPSWSSAHEVALYYAREGLTFERHLKDPRLNHGSRSVWRVPIHLLPVKGAVVIKAKMHREIISGPIPHIRSKHEYHEFVCDPRDVKYETIEELKPPTERRTQP
jgi:hypothetical protein